MKEEWGQQVSDESRPDDAGGRMDLGLLAVSACLLTLQVLQTKIFAYSLDPLTIYLAIGVCMLGLGASATVLAILPPLAVNRVRGVASAFAAAGAVAMDRRAEARMKGYEGDACGDCGNFTLVRNGTCLKCDTCGATSGCS